MSRGKAADHVTSVERPADFDEFWDAIMSEAASIPLEPTFKEIPLRSTEDVVSYEIHYNSIDGVRIAGYYSVPRESYLEPPYPGLLIVPGYISDVQVPKEWAKLGYAAVGVAPRGKLRSNGQYNPGYPGLLTDNFTDRNTSAYRGFYVDACRAVDFLQTRPEVAQDRIGVHGSSQGGALTITTSALRSDAITCGAGGAPYLCGFMDAASLTHSYPYEEINEYLRVHPDREQQVRDTVAYFDGINFAPGIQSPTLIYAGLGDDVCPPETAFDLVAAMTNCDVEFNTYERCAHDAGNYWEMPNVKTFLAKHLQPAKNGGAK